MPPTSLARVKAALRRLSPAFPNVDEDTSAGKELDSIAQVFATVVDRFDAAQDEIYPDTASETLERWEKITRNPTRTTDTDEVRQARVLSVLRRSSGARLDQLGKALAPVLDTTEFDLQFIEILRSQIDEALTIEDSATHAITSTPRIFNLGKPWPGNVDGTGVSIYLALSSLGTPNVTVTSPAGTVWTPTITSTAGWYHNRVDFLDEVAGGDWLISVANASSVNQTDLKLLVSNDIDAAQIYNFFCFRDPDLPGTPDIAEGQRIFHRMALGHMRAFVTQSEVCIVGDEFSLCGREPVGN